MKLTRRQGLIAALTATFAKHLSVNAGRVIGINKPHGGLIGVSALDIFKKTYGGFEIKTLFLDRETDSHAAGQTESDSAADAPKNGSD